MSVIKDLIKVLPRTFKGVGVSTARNVLHIHLRFIRICGFSLREGFGSVQSVMNVTELNAVRERASLRE
jgi:hypothetical protein